MTPYEIHTQISAYLSDNWTLSSIREINKDTSKTIPYIELYFMPGIIESLEIQGVGNRVGVFIINIFTQKGIGVQQGEYFGGELEKLFWHKTISGVTCESNYILPYTKFIGIDDDLQACHHQTIIPFHVIMEY